MTKEEKGYPKEKLSLIIMDTFKGQGNDTYLENYVPKTIVKS